MTAPAPENTIEPGLYDIPAELYHSDPVPGGSLSSTGARKLATQCPAKFKHWLDNPQPPKTEFDFGTAAHTIVLGDGPDLLKIEHDDWRTTEAKTEVAAARAAGKAPLKPADYQAVHDMATELLAHPEARDLLAAGSGEAEQSMFWEQHGIWRRARIDWLRPDGIVDYKTTRSADPEYLEKAVHEYGYHQQHEFYLDGAIHLGLLPPDAPFTFVFQEKTEPYVVTVAHLDGEFRDIGRRLNERAFFLYAHCRETGQWPAYTDGTAIVSPPAWVGRQYRQENP